ncbi:MAG: ABC transporter ATP-binding protein [Candidatus Omnitrophica bacterium]|nr:ABC transporter ATP-binding protein [Candidatus Omnitrophota bacterium]
MIKATNIHKSYISGNKTLHVLKGVDINIEPGKLISIVGPSGAGKSTLLHILGGLDAPSQGEVNFEGNNIYELSDIALSQIRNERIGFVFQFYHLLPEFDLLENVMMPLLVGRKVQSEKHKAKEEAVMLIEKVGLGKRMDHFPNELSGGEQQRAAICRALINRPALLLCDEPTGNLDAETGEEIILLIKRINQENNTAVALVTHNLELAKISDKIYYLKDGVLVN